ncbi:hypothetical protein ACX27_05300 [Nostoc piscinale CENA21]|uniref:Uncharacterized protein n=1 Tax=Nostoc piscinale CENA21 TaxID=224013 RepID=A0A0M4SV93_9NOSO|nr:hypothetical protein [Nostoc piscinale]ALF52396.1 hypothetical protein ACX27_05300 [Nostoc piscinale CENA21]
MDIKLGFGSIPKPQYVFVSKENDHCWYTLSDDGKQIPIYDRALTGVITEIEVNKIVETSQGKSEKTDLHILADKPYIIRSGSESYFSKGLLLSLDALSYEKLLQPLTIAVSPGEKAIVFCTIYHPVTYRSVGVSWDGHKEIDWQVLGKRVSLKINGTKTVTSDTKEILNNGITAEIRADFIAKTDTYLSQLNWTPQQGREYLQQKYGKKSRHHLSETELVDFVDYLQLQLTLSY